MRKRPLTQYAEQLRTEYLAAARDQQWRECLRIAERLQTLHLSNRDGAEAIFAAGYAHERLGDQHQAKVHYEMALMIDRNNDKARRRLKCLRD